MRVVFLVMLLGGGIWLWTVLFPSPERVVLKKITRVAADANIALGEGNISRASKASSLTGEFDVNAEIVVDVAGIGAHTLSGRDEIREAALGVFTNLRALKTQFLDTKVTLGADNQSATVTCTAQVSESDNRDYGIQELRFQLKKIDGDWKITRVETVKTLQ